MYLIFKIEFLWQKIMYRKTNSVGVSFFLVRCSTCVNGICRNVVGYCYSLRIFSRLRLQERRSVQAGRVRVNAERNKSRFTFTGVATFANQRRFFLSDRRRKRLRYQISVLIVCEMKVKYTRYSKRVRTKLLRWACHKPASEEFGVYRASPRTENETRRICV